MTECNKAVTRKVRTHVPHGVRDRFAITIYPNGTIGMRELGRALRTEQKLDCGVLYVAAIQSAVRKADKLTRDYAKSMTRKEARRKARTECGL